MAVRPLGFVLLVQAVLVTSASCTNRERASNLEITNGAEMVAIPASDNASAIVFVFVLHDCPICNRYAPEIQRLRDSFEPQGVEFWAIYVDAGTSDDIIASHAASFGHDDRFAIDRSRSLVRRTGVQTAPEAVVMLPSGEILYRGRIDDRYVARGKWRPEPQRPDLEIAIEHVLAGEPPPAAEGPAIGCAIPEVS